MIPHLPDLVAKRAELSPDRVALHEPGRGLTLTYRDLDTAAARAAGALAALDVGPGDRVAILCRNRIEFFTLLFACAKLGAVLTPLNWRMPAHELGPQIEFLRPRLLIHGREDQAVAAAAAEASGLTIVGLDDPGVGGFAARSAACVPHPGRDAWPGEEAWYLIGTSGTTGRPKAVINTYAMALVNAINIGSAVGLTSESRTVCFLPLFHAGGVGLHALPTLLVGGRVTVLPGFDAGALMGLIRSGELDAFFGVPAVYLQLSLQPGFDGLDLSGVRSWACGGAPLPDSLVTRFAERGALVCNGMGMTETGPTMFLMDPGSVLGKIGSVGKPQLLARARIVGADGRDVEPGATGELWFSGPGVTPGYWGDEAATRAAFAPDGWLRSGDLGRIDGDGYYYVAGRLKEMFITGGENVFPAEVENVLASHPDVLEASVIATSDPRWGEVGRAYVILRGGAGACPETLDAYCRGRLAAYKAPKTYAFVEDLPRNAMGKVLKHRLTELDVR